MRAEARTCPVRAADGRLRADRPLALAALLLVLLAALLGPPARAQRVGARLGSAAALPGTCKPGTPIIVTNGSNSADCSTGGGSDIHVCYCNSAGTGWQAEPLTSLADDTAWVGSSSGVAAAELLPDTDADGQALGWDQTTNAFTTNTNVGSSVGESELAAEDYGDFSCGAGADDCFLDAGVVDGTALATAVRTRACATYNVENAQTGDDGKFQAKVMQAATLVRVSCSTSAATASVQLYERAENSPNSGTTGMLTTALACNSDTTADATTSFSDSAVAADSVLALGVTASTLTSSDLVRVYVECTVD